MKKILLGVLLSLLGIFSSCENPDDQIICRFNIENHTSHVIGVEGVIYSFTNDFFLRSSIGPHQTQCVKQIKLFSTGSSWEMPRVDIENPENSLHYTVMTEVFFQELKFRIGETDCIVKDTENSPVYGKNYVYDPMMSYDHVKCFVFQITDEYLQSLIDSQ